jgi:hypothetical protein
LSACSSRRGAVELEEQQEVVHNNTNYQEEGAPELQPPGPKSSNVQDFFDTRTGKWGQDEADEEGTLGEEEEVDAFANIARQIEGEISKYHQTSLSAPKIFTDPLIWWEQKQFQFPILSACLAQKYLCSIPATEAPSEWIFSTASLLYWANSEAGWTQTLLVEWFSSRRILNGMKNSSRRQVRKNEVVWNWGATSREDGSASDGNIFMC